MAFQQTISGSGKAIDLHSHILPDMDDGSKSVGQSLEMLQESARQGVGIMVATPHYYAEQNSPEMFLQRRARAYEQLTESISTQSSLPQIFCAAEVAYFSGMSSHSDLHSLCIEGTNTLLLEMPFCNWNDFQIEEVSALALDLGYQLVLVHPERFCFSPGNRRRLEKLADLPLALQVNAGSLLHWRTRKLALELLQMTRHPLLGSDCHNLTTRPPNLRDGRDVIQKKLGQGFLRRMDEEAALLLPRSST